jgi:hypothetical protein
MELDRNQWFMIGLVVLFLGIQVRMVDTVVLNEKASKVLAERVQPVVSDGSGEFPRFLASVGPVPRRTVKPPPWLGFALISVGTVLILHSLAMKKPGAG